MITYRIPTTLCAEHYYVKTVDSSKGRRLNLLPGQYLQVNDSDEDVAEGDTTWNVRANKENRNDYPLGQVFQLNSCIVVVSTSGIASYVSCSDRKYFHPVTASFAEEQIAKAKTALFKTVETTEVETILDSMDDDDDKETATPASKDSESFIDHLAALHPKPSLADSGFYVDDKIWQQLTRHCARKKNVLIVGDSGVGKTELCSLLAESFKRQLVIHDMGATQDPIASLLGVHRISSEGKSIFDTAQFVTDIQGPNFILMDEVNRAPLNTNNILFPLTDSRRSLDMAIASSDVARKVHVHTDVVFVATANIGSEFTGTNVLDEAFKNRFVTVHLDYPPASVEGKLLVKRTGVDKVSAAKIVTVANKTRAKHKNETISNNISIRQTLEIAEMVADGFNVENAIEYFLLPLFGEEFSEVRDIIHSL